MGLMLPNKEIEVTKESPIRTEIWYERKGTISHALSPAATRSKECKQTF
jgi:hypothetical protein